MPGRSAESEGIYAECHRSVNDIKITHPEGAPPSGLDQGDKDEIVMPLRYFPHESFKVTTRLNTGFPGLESVRSATK